MRWLFFIFALRGHPIFAPAVAQLASRVSKVNMNNETRYLIYSLNKNLWYKANCAGYTENKREAGQYTGEELLEALCEGHAEDWDKKPELSVIRVPVERDA